jgi:hypothetical protein
MYSLWCLTSFSHQFFEIHPYCCTYYLFLFIVTHYSHCVNLPPALSTSRIDGDHQLYLSPLPTEVFAFVPLSTVEQCTTYAAGHSKDSMNHNASSHIF